MPNNKLTDNEYKMFTQGECLQTIANLKAEIERLKPLEKFAEFKSHIRVEDMLVCANSLDEWLEFCDNLKAEAYKEFAERLDNETFGVYYASSLYHVVDIDDVKEILKELVGENK